MGKLKVFAAVAIMLVLCGFAKGGISVIVNNSFEYDGRVINPITEEDVPQRWDDVNIPPQKFGAALLDDWVVEGRYNLTLHSYRYVQVEAEEMATVSQNNVYLSDFLVDANYVSFNLNLYTTPSTKVWNPQNRSVVILIDDEIVWTFDNGLSDLRGQYYDLECPINPIYKDGNPHKLSLGIRSNVSESVPLTRYTVQWDIVRLDAHCFGDGYLPTDFNYDCYVDFNDLKLFVAEWLIEEPPYEYDLYVDDSNVVDMHDFGVFAVDWMCNSFGYIQDDELLAMDLNNDGIINLKDFVIHTSPWQEKSFEDVNDIFEYWLQTSWLYWLE